MRRIGFTAAILTALSALGAHAQQNPIVIESTTVVSPHLEEPLKGVSILVEGDRIAAIAPGSRLRPPPRSRRIDGRGRWVMPGIVEFHSHATGRAALKRALALGVTTAQTIARPESPRELERMSNQPGMASPRLILVTGYVGEFMERMGAKEVSKPRTVKQARSDVQEMNQNGVRRIKVWQDDGTLWFAQERSFPSLPAEVFEELVRAAHARGMEVVVHAWRFAFLRQALEVGVDRIIHPVADSLVPESVWTRMHEQDLAWTSTMTALLIYGDPGTYARRALSDPRLFEALSDEARARLARDTAATSFATDSFMPTLRRNHDRYIEIVQRNTVAARSAGVPIVVGSDAPPGVGTHIELELMREAGLSLTDLLSAATLNGAEALDLEDGLGTVETGKLADLVILNADPTSDIRNWRDIHVVLKGGKPYGPGELLSTVKE